MHRLNPYLEKKPDFVRLASRFPDFAVFVTVAEDGHASINFQDPAALRALTRCLLKEDWDLEVDLREDRLCPTLANRLDYLLHVLDLELHLPFASSSRPLKVLDVGTGASAIYPILLHRLRPEAEISATELDETSYTHSLAVLTKNNIPSSAITIHKSPASEPILFPLLDDTTTQLDLVICNPPFFGSEEEIAEGQEGKELSAHAAPTAAANELITPGGEVAFVGKMIDESVKIGDRCRWYTSLVGKFSSLQPLVDTLKHHQIDNYMLKNIRQAKTTRWILGWSHSPVRLPDSLARPEDVIPNTAFTKLLPPSNTFSHIPQPPLSVDELRKAVSKVMAGICLDPSSASSDPAIYDDDNESDFMISPKTNTWSRSARRQAARQEQGENSPDVLGSASSTAATSITNPHSDMTPNGANASAVSDQSSIQPLFAARVRCALSPREREGAILSLDWIEGKGKEREQLDALWKYVLSKAGLVGPKAGQDGGYGARLGGGVEWRARGRGKSWRGASGRGGSGRDNRHGGAGSANRGERGKREVNEEDFIASRGQRRRLM